MIEELQKAVPQVKFNGLSASLERQFTHRTQRSHT